MFFFSFFSQDRVIDTTGLSFPQPGGPDLRWTLSAKKDPGKMFETNREERWVEIDLYRTVLFIDIF